MWEIEEFRNGSIHIYKEIRLFKTFLTWSFVTQSLCLMNTNKNFSSKCKIWKKPIMKKWHVGETKYPVMAEWFYDKSEIAGQ